MPKLERIEFLVGQNSILSSRVLRPTYKSLWDSEVSVYSQWGEDGILDYLCSAIGLVKPRILELGAGNFIECNSRFLAEFRHASVVAVDGRNDLEESVNSLGVSWKTHILPIQTWITPESIAQISKSARDFLDGIDILSMDIDGNDYWVLENFDFSEVSVVVVEYNPLFGYKKAVTVPRNDTFQRTKEHSSNLYYGASLPAWVNFFEMSGFNFVGSNSVGSNAFFLKAKYLDCLDFELPIELSSHTDWRVRESIDLFGNLTKISNLDRVALIEDLPLFDLQTSQITTVGQAVEGY